MTEPPERPPGPDDETVIRDEWGPEDETFVQQVEEVEEPPGPRPPKIWPWLLALLVLVLGGLGALWYFTQDDEDDAAETTATAARTASVPDVVGTTSSEATATLRAAGFDANVVSVPSEAPAGQVVAQAPAAGEEAAEGSVVRINVARPGDEPTTTDTTGTTDTTATTTTAATTTAATTTAATTTAPAEPEPATVPDAVGEELADAAEEFGDEGLRVAVQYVPSTEARGTVVAQARPPGTELTRGDTVQLNVSTGADPPADAPVPDVTALEDGAARDRLEQAGFEVLAIEVDEADEGTVVSQSPSGGASIPRGSLVLLYVGD
jgi:eukaryotic-like serine/threonine-protein kinase